MGTRGNDGPDRRAVLRRMGLAGGGAVLGGAAALTGQRIWNAEDPQVPVSAASVESWLPPGRQVDIVWAVDTRARRIALTFDDGPLPNWTPKALDALDAAKVPATFFVVGSRLVKHAALVRDRLARHEVGNHTWKHQDLSLLSHREAYRSINRTHEAIADITGKEPTLLRPPWGRLGGTTLHVAAEHGYDIALWSLLVRDRRFRHDPAALVGDVSEHIRPGSILLAHDVGMRSRLGAVEQLPAIIRAVRAKGYEFVTVSRLRTGAAR